MTRTLSLITFKIKITFIFQDNLGLFRLYYFRNNNNNNNHVPHRDNIFGPKIPVQKNSMSDDGEKKKVRTSNPGGHGTTPEVLRRFLLVACLLLGASAKIIFLLFFSNFWADK